MDNRVVITDLSESMRRGGTAFLHLLKDAAVVNSNLYGEHGEFPLSLDSLMEGCDFYSSQHDSGGDIFALMLTAGMFFGTYSSIFLASPLLVWVEEIQAKNKENKSIVCCDYF